jgi:RND superfamily putative drug exporter
VATVLHRLGRLAFRRRGVVLLLWVLALAAAGAGAATLAQPTSNAFSIPGTESQRALDLLSQRTRANADVATARVVFVADGGTTLTTSAAQGRVERAVRKLSALPKVAAVTDPYAVQAVSADQRTAFATVTYAVSATNLTSADRSRLLAAGRSAQSADLAVELGGDAVQEPPAQNAGEALGLLVAAVTLVVTFGALVAAGLPLLTALIGVGLGVLGIEVATHFLELSSTTSTLALMLGLAVGIDYALFIVSRYRHELLRGRSPEDAVGRAVGTAGSAVVFAGATVVIALAALSVVGIPFLTQMGVAAAGTVLCAVVIALTLLPALLGFAGTRVLGRRGRAARDTEGDPDAAGGALAASRPLGERWARGVLRHRVVAVLVTVVGLGIVAGPALDLRLALPSDASASSGTTQRKAYDALAAGFGPGFNGPLVVVADLAKASDGERAARSIATNLGQLRDVVAVSSTTTTPDGRTAIYSVIPESGPTSAATEDLVHAIRGDAPAWRAATGASVFVTGTTAVGIDVSQKLSDALVPYLAVVVGLAFVLLTLVFRSLLVPLKATAGFLLSVAVAFGAVVAVFQKGWAADLLGVDTSGPIVSFLPILLVGILFGLAMDYEVFLVTRMREEHVHGASADESVALGFRHGARVVTAAAIIMVAVFAGFVTADEAVIKSIGFALAVGVFADAFLVRMTLVPAVMSLLGERAWWLPRWLDRFLPDLDVEGEQLTKALDGGARDQAPAVVPAVAGATGPLVGGTVRRHDSRPMAGAVVTLADQSGRQVARATTGPDGGYRLDVPTGGTYLLIVAAPQVAPSAVLVAVADAPVTRDVTLSGGSAITGRVLARDHAADGQDARDVLVGVPGALVALTDVTGEVVGSSRTDRSGSYAFGRLTGGSYVLTARAEGRRPLARAVDVPDAGALAVDLHLTGGSRLTGTVVAARDGRPLREATVTLVDAQGIVVGSATTGSEGAWSFDDLDSGHYTVTAAGYAPTAFGVEVEDHAPSRADVALGARVGPTDLAGTRSWDARPESG